MAGAKRKQKKARKQQVNARHKAVPHLHATPAGKHVPSSATTAVEVNNARVRWTCHQMDIVECKEDGRRWSLSAKEAETILRFLTDLGQKTWGQVMAEKDSYNRPMNHAHPIGELAKPARRRLEELYEDSEEYLFRFRLGGAQRLWGIRSGDTFRVLWWDPDHQVYPVGKKNT